MGVCCSCLCSSLKWLMATAINVAILALLGLALLYWQNWPAALAGSVVYLLFLLLTTRRYHALEEIKAARKEEEDTTTTTTTTTTSQHDNNNSTAQEEGHDWEETDPAAHTDETGGDGVFSSDESAIASSPSSSAIPSSTTRVQRILEHRRKRHKTYLREIPFGLSVLYFLVNFMWAVPGAIVVFFAFPCKDLVADPLDSMQHHRRQVYWKTNMTNLPTNVHSWIKEFEVGNYVGSGTRASSFVQTGSTLYVFGSYQDEPAQLYAVQEVGVAPNPLEYYGEVRELTAVADETVCFLHKSQEGGFKGYGSHLLCGDVTNGFKEATIPRNRFSFGLTSIDGVLWFLQIRADYYVFDPARGGSCNFDAVVRCINCFIPACQARTMKVVSLDLATMTLTSHSQRYTTARRKKGHRLLEATEAQPASQEDYYYDDDSALAQGQDDAEMDTNVDDDGVAKLVDSDIFCDGNMLNRMRAFGALFLSAIPLLFNSGRVWVRYAIPSASVAMFLGIGYALYCIWGFLDPEVAPAGFRIWLYFGTPVWLLVCTYQVVVNPLVSKAPLWWSLYLITTALVLLLVSQEYWEVFNIRAMDTEEITMWFIDILIIHGPLLMITILTKSVYIAFLSIVAFLLLTSILVWRMTDTIHSTLVYGGIAYAAVVVVVLIVYRFRNSLHDVFFRWLSICARHTCAIEAIDDEEEHEENTAGLLLSEEAERA